MFYELCGQINALIECSKIFLRCITTVILMDARTAFCAQTEQFSTKRYEVSPELLLFEN